MACLSRGGHFAYGCFPGFLVSLRRDCLAGSGLSEFDGRVHIHSMDCSVPVNFMTTLPLDKEMVTNAGRNQARKLGGVTSEARWRKLLGRTISIVIVAAAVILGLAVLYRENYYPRTEDAEIFANFIGIAPQVDGPLTRLSVKDNQFVKKGELLYEIDERPYQYALENAISEQSTLEGQVGDEQRKIAALESAVSVAEANIHSSEADVVNAERGVDRARAEWTYANNNLHRIEPLLAKQFVTVDEVDKAKSSEAAEVEALRQAESRLQLAKAELNSVLAQHQQARHAVTTLEPLINQRGAKAAAVKKARYDLDNCRVYAPFDARVTNLTISEGAYAHSGQQMFTLIDARTWWAVGNFREGQLTRITPGMRADVYLMSMPNLRFAGVVDSVGFGVTPDPDKIGKLQPGLPDLQRTLNWVHLASRFPVRVRIENPTPDLFRISESAVITIRGD